MKTTRKTPDKSRPLLDIAREARRSAVLREASAEFLRTGVAGANLPAIARRLGLSRASLYNYCTGREDLARQCYLEALTSLREMPSGIGAEGGGGLDRFVAFVRVATEYDRPLAAIAAELDLLPDSARLEIENAQEQIFATLSALTAGGIADGTIRPCDPAIVARTIWGLISWIPIGEMWAGRSGDGLTARMEGEIVELIEHGIVSERARARGVTASSALLAPLWDERPESRAEEIMRSASNLFNRRGIEGVSLDDVAADLSATKGLVYHHFSSKAALVRACFDRAFDLYDRIMDLAEAEGDGLEQFRRGLELNVQAQLHPQPPLNALYRRLPADDQIRVATRSTTLLGRSTAGAERGMDDGSLRRFDATAVSLAAAGSFLFLGRWLPRDTVSDAVHVAREASSLFLYGLRATP
ncbi:MAG TPA: TetR/AcrR family transcriptional regulator [Sphingomonas sp.]